MAIQAKYTAAAGLNQTLVEDHATAVLATTAPVTLTSTIRGDSTHGNTFELQVLANANNPGEAVLVAFTGTPSAIVCTVTPDDAVLTITTAEFVELIATGAVAGKAVTVTDTQGLRTLVRASGGGAQGLVNAGEGDNLKTAFSSAASVADFHVEGCGVASDVETLPQQVVTIACPASSVAGFAGQKFTLYDADGKQYTYLMQVDGAPAAGPGETPITMNNTRNAAQAAVIIEGVIDNAAASWTSAVADDDITVTNVKVGKAKEPTTSGADLFTIAVAAAGSGDNKGALSTHGLTIIDTSAACTLTLGNLTAADAGQIKTVVRTANGATTNADLTVAKHVNGGGGNNELLRFDAGEERVCMVWLGTTWANIGTLSATQA